MFKGFVMKFPFLIFIVVGVVAAQSSLPKRDIPTIAKAANGSVVSIVMSDKGGKPISQGSGFLVTKDGLILTNYHVIETGSSAVVKLPDGAFFLVDGVVASDKTRDIAVIQAHGQNFQTLTLGNSDQIQVGEEIVAIGNPLSLESTVSNGIVSGIRTDERPRIKVLQVTAPISPGSSGGPLFNMAGEVIGITTMYLQGGENLNFAVPINDAKRLLLEKSAKLQDLPNEIEPGEEQTHKQDGSALTPRASLQDTLQWMHNSLLDQGVVPSIDFVSSTELIEFSGCHVRFAYSIHYDSGGTDKTVREDYSFNLGDMDPETIIFAKFPENKYPDVPNDDGAFRATTINYSKKVLLKTADGKLEHTDSFPTWFFYPGYGARFAEAFRHAVTLCGGKPSTF